MAVELAKTFVLVKTRNGIVVSVNGSFEIGTLRKEMLRQYTEELNKNTYNMCTIEDDKAILSFNGTNTVRWQIVESDMLPVHSGDDEFHISTEQTKKKYEVCWKIGNEVQESEQCDSIYEARTIANGYAHRIFNLCDDLCKMAHCVSDFGANHGMSYNGTNYSVTTTKLS